MHCLETQFVFSLLMTQSNNVKHGITVKVVMMAVLHTMIFCLLIAHRGQDAYLARNWNGDGLH